MTRKYTKKIKAPTHNRGWEFNDKLLIFILYRPESIKVEDLVLEVDVEEMSLNDWLKKLANDIPKDDLLELEKLWIKEIGTRDKTSIMTFSKRKIASNL